MVTLALRAWQMVANSTPTGPPPTIRMSLGTRPRFRIVSVSQTPGMSKEMFFGRAGPGPVAIRIIFARSVRSFPLLICDNDSAVSDGVARHLEYSRHHFRRYSRLSPFAVARRHPRSAYG